MTDTQMQSVAAVVIHPSELPEWIRFLDQTGCDQSRAQSINPSRGDLVLTRDGKPSLILRFTICD